MTGDASLVPVLSVIDDPHRTRRSHDHGKEKSDASDA
jgi:hypothetical protein